MLNSLADTVAIPASSVTNATAQAAALIGSARNTHRPANPIFCTTRRQGFHDCIASLICKSQLGRCGLGITRFASIARWFASWWIEAIGWRLPLHPCEDFCMTGDRNISLPLSQSDAAQIWIIGTRDQVVHLMNEFTVKRMVGDRTQFTPIVPAPFAAGKYMTVLLR